MTSCGDVADVGVLLGVGIVVREDFAAPSTVGATGALLPREVLLGDVLVLAFGLEDDLHPGELEAAVDSADAGERRPDLEAVTQSPAFSAASSHSR